MTISGVMDIVIMRILIVNPGHPIMMTHEITVSGMIGVILRMLKDIVTLSQRIWETILSLLCVHRYGLVFGKHGGVKGPLLVGQVWSKERFVVD